MKKLTRIYLRVLVFTCLFVLSLNIFAQKESWNWYFGDHAAISFNSGTPYAMLNSAMMQGEGCASISDSAGNLLFYTDGMKVYNAIHQVMPNGSGLMGAPSSSQSAVIVKMPGSTLLYYIFTVDENFNNGLKGFRYSLVDMSLNGGLGDVTATNKNVLVRNNVMERLTVARHRNGSDFWILITDYSEDEIFAYRLSCSGLNPVPVKSSTGPYFLGNWRATFGYMKVSKQNDQLAMAGWFNRSVIVLEFNNSTGIASNRRNITNSQGKIDNFIYGVEFSPDGKILYATSVDGPRTFIGNTLLNDTLRLFQFNLALGNPVTIGDSVKIIASHTDIWRYGYSGYYGALQLGPDNKIYSCNINDTVLGIIHDPNLAGAFCNYVNNGVNLRGRQCGAGLPNMFVNYVLPAYDTSYASICSGGSYMLCNGSTVNTAGMYSCHITTPTSCDSVVITSLAVVNIDTVAGNFVVCRNQLPYSWHGQLLSVPGTYYYALSNPVGCDSVFKLRFGVSPVSDSSLSTVAICDNQLPFAWNKMSLTAPGIYYATLQTFYGCDSVAKLRLIVKYTTSSVTDTSICSNELPFSWNGKSCPAAGIYHVLYTNVAGCDSITTLNLFVRNAPVSYFKDGYTVSEGASMILKPVSHMSAGISYLWSPPTYLNNETDAAPTVINPLNDIVYQLKLTENNCSTVTSIKVSILVDIIIPNTFTPNGDRTNDTWKIAGLSRYPDHRVQIFTRAGQLVYQTANYPANGWNGTYLLQPLPIDTYYYIIIPAAGKEPLTGFVTIIR